jgi:hypothetical protein
MPQQDFKNHSRYVPLFHFVTVGLLAINFVHAARRLLPFSAESFYPMSLATALILMVWFVRAFPVTVQDRVIRLEEKLRLDKLAPELAVGFDSFSPQQWTALRFASDAELPGLARDVLAGKLTKPDDIKRAVKVWRPDNVRV